MLIGLGALLLCQAPGAADALTPAQETESAVQTLEAARALDQTYRATPRAEFLWQSAIAYERGGALLEARERLYRCVSLEELSPSQRREAAIMLASVERRLLTQGPLPPLREERSFDAPKRFIDKASAPLTRQNAPRTDEPESPKVQPLSEVMRPLTLVRNTWRIAGGTGLGHSALSDELAFGISAALSYGIIDALEIGSQLLSLRLYEHVVYDRPSLYLMAQLGGSARATLGAKVEIVAGVQTHSPWSLTTGLPARFLLLDWLRMDTGLYAEFLFTDARVFNLHFPLQMHLQITPQVFTSLNTAFVWVDTEEVIIPLGAGVGYTFADEERPLCDLTLHLTWPLFHQAEREEIDVETLTTELSARCFL